MPNDYPRLDYLDAISASDGDMTDRRRLPHVIIS